MRGCCPQDCICLQLCVRLSLVFRLNHLAHCVHVYIVSPLVRGRLSKSMPPFLSVSLVRVSADCLMDNTACHTHAYLPGVVSSAHQLFMHNASPVFSQYRQNLSMTIRIQYENIFLIILLTMGLAHVGVVVNCGVGWGAVQLLRSASICVMSRWPFFDAKRSAVHPSSVWADMSAPRSMNICTRSAWPFADAKCSTVHPSCFLADTSAPCSKSICVRST